MTELPWRWSLREAPPIVYQALAELTEAVNYLKRGDLDEAQDRLRVSNRDDVRRFILDSWGNGYKRFQYLRPDPELPQRTPGRKAPISDSTRSEVIARDGYLCRYCRMPLLSRELIKELNRSFPEITKMSAPDSEKHAVLMCCRVEFDHIKPASRGGLAERNNVVACCPSCNYCKEGYTLNELGIWHPGLRPILKLDWNGLSQ